MTEMRRININVAGRNYPLNVPEEEEEAFRKVGKQIGEMIKNFEANYNPKDKQDTLAMCAIELGLRAENAEKEKEKSERKSIEKLMEISGLIDE